MTTQKSEACEKQLLQLEEGFIFGAGFECMKLNLNFILY